MDTGSDQTKIGANILQCHSADGAVPWLSFFAESAAVISIRKRRPARLVWSDQAKGKRKSLGTHGRHVGWSRLQPKRRRISCTAVSIGTNFLPRTFRQGRRESCIVAAGCLRVRMGTAATDQTGRLEIFYDHQDWLESIQPVAIWHLHVAWYWWNADPHPLQHCPRHWQLRQHIQRVGRCTRSSWHLEELSAKRIAQGFAYGIRLRGWRRWSNSRDAWEYRSNETLPCPATDEAIECEKLFRIH